MANRSLMGDHPQEPPLLSTALSAFADELHRLLVQEGELQLAAQVPTLRMVDRCRCGDDFCAMFYVLPKPKGAYGNGHRNVPLDPEQGMLVLDVVDEKIAAVEVLYRNDIRGILEQILPLKEGK